MGGGEDAGVSGYSAHAAGGGVVDGAAEEVVEVGVGGGGTFVVVGGGGGVGIGWSPSDHTITRGAALRGVETRQQNIGAKTLNRATGFFERMIAGPGHAEGDKDVLSRIDIEWLPAELFDECSEGDEVDVGVFEVGAGCCDQR